MITGHGSGRFDPGSEWVSDFPKGLTLDLNFVMTSLTRPAGSGQMGSGQGRPGFKAVLTRTAATLRCGNCHEVPTPMHKSEYKELCRKMNYTGEHPQKRINRPPA